jgi:hypothetical protein
LTQHFFEQPILNSPYGYPARHWELDDDGQPTDQILPSRRRSELITPVPQPKKRRQKRGQKEMVFDEGKGLSTEAQQYDPTPIINDIRSRVDGWRSLPNPDDWQVSPETARLLQHWRQHPYQSQRPFFCQVEAIETIIWLTEVAPKPGKRGEKFWQHVKGANEQANPELIRPAPNGSRWATPTSLFQHRPGHPQASGSVSLPGEGPIFRVCLAAAVVRQWTIVPRVSFAHATGTGTPAAPDLLHRIGDADSLVDHCTINGRGRCA